jgi:hypothetical protein
MGRTLGRTRERAFWWTVAGLLPLAYASSYVAIGPTPAEGCSGSPAEERVGVTYFSATAEEASVGRDGFFAFYASIANTTAEAALAGITVEVLDANGEPVPGETVLISEDDDDDGTSGLTLGWSATGAAGEGGEVLAFHASAMNTNEPVTLDATLTVVDIEPELTLPSVEVSGWTRARHDGGPRVDCYAFDSCSNPFDFGAEFVDRLHMNFEVGPLTPEVLVLWEFEWLSVAGKGVLLSDSSPFRPGDGFSSSLMFEHEEEELCVRLRGRDLHTGDTMERELCASPSGELDERTYDSIRECEEPPPGYFERWCLATEGEELGYETECEPYLNPSTGTGGSGGASSGTGGASEPGAGGTGSGAKGGTTGGGGRPTGAGAAAGSTATGEPPVAGSSGSGDGPSDDGGLATAGAPSDGEAGSSKGSKPVLTEAGCGCRAAGGERGDSRLGGAGLAVLAVGLGLRRRRERRAAFAARS